MNESERLNLARQLYAEGDYYQAADLYEQAIKENPILLKSAYGVSLAHALILSLDWHKIANYLPPEVNFLETSGWLKSLQLGKPVNSKLEAIPWYTYPAIEFIEDKIEENFVVFEYGSGQSTLWWSKKVHQLITIESNKQWFDYLQNNTLKDSKVSLKLIEEEEEYIKEISQFPEEYFDVIIIDGERRSDCAKESFCKLKEDGFIVFDDTDRESYDGALLFLESQGFYRLDFAGMTPSLTYKNCTSILFKNFNFLKRGSLPSQKQSCLGKSYSQKDQQKSDYFTNLESLSIFDELELSEYNSLIFPDWDIDREILTEELIKIIENLLGELPDKNYTFLVYIGAKNKEIIESFMEEMVMFLIMEKNINFPKNFKISLLPSLTEYQWNVLTSKINKKIKINYENNEAKNYKIE
jgi:hypothetical protein